MKGRLEVARRPGSRSISNGMDNADQLDRSSAVIFSSNLQSWSAPHESSYAVLISREEILWVQLASILPWSCLPAYSNRFFNVDIKVLCCQRRR